MLTVTVGILDSWKKDFEPQFLYIGAFIIDLTLIDAIIRSC